MRLPGLQNVGSCPGFGKLLRSFLRKISGFSKGGIFFLKNAYKYLILGAEGGDDEYYA